MLSIMMLLFDNAGQIHQYFLLGTVFKCKGKNWNAVAMPYHTALQSKHLMPITSEICTAALGPRDFSPTITLELFRFFFNTYIPTKTRSAIRSS